MKTPMTLLTIVTEGILKDEMIGLLREKGATGHTRTRADGEGSRGTRATDWEGPNLRFEAVVSEGVADSILEVLEERYFAHYAVIAWTCEVGVLRGAKFAE